MVEAFSGISDICLFRDWPRKLMLMLEMKQGFSYTRES